jgi:hypothetical protein
LVVSGPAPCAKAPPGKAERAAVRRAAVAVVFRIERRLRLAVKKRVIGEDPLVKRTRS